MRHLTILVLMLASFPVLAQNIHGVVADRITHLPITYAIIKTQSNTVYTDRKGAFNLKATTDTAIITYMGYKPYHLVLNPKIITDNIRVYLEQVSILLKDVKIGASRNFQADSLRNRRMFSSVYNSKLPGIKDALTQKASLAYVPDNYINAPNNTTSIFGINILSVIGLLNKNNSPVYNLQKAMLKDEESSYVDRRFSKQRVEAITALKGDSLQNFMLKYRPAITEVKTMTDYDLMIYIKRNYTEFIKAK